SRQVGHLVDEGFPAEDRRWIHDGAPRARRNGARRGDAIDAQRRPLVGIVERTPWNFVALELVGRNGRPWTTAPDVPSFVDVVNREVRVRGPMDERRLP